MRGVGEDQGVNVEEAKLEGTDARHEVLGWELSWFEESLGGLSFEKGTLSCSSLFSCLFVIFNLFSCLFLFLSSFFYSWVEALFLPLGLRRAFSKLQGGRIAIVGSGDNPTQQLHPPATAP
ncbi:hypothetical protein RJT34_13785 [Clitoria ternatea]|uniref:Uncharacterized protein n=1 Tax=Clitoria ternatea TaxID=43366 RepID=A0AAN9JPK4_CLITE